MDTISLEILCRDSLYSHIKAFRYDHCHENDEGVYSENTHFQVIVQNRKWKTN